jgi:hypothetical protein
MRTTTKTNNLTALIFMENSPLLTVYELSNTLCLRKTSYDAFEQARLLDHSQGVADEGERGGLKGKAGRLPCASSLGWRMMGR